MIRFHNKVFADKNLVTEFGGDPTDAVSRFRTAVNIVRWHYQLRKEATEVNEKRIAIRDKWVNDNGSPLKGNAPLWYYILREAEYYGVEHDPFEKAVGFGGQHLGPVGSRIIAETIIGLLWMDQNSFLHDTRGFKPMRKICGTDEMSLAALISRP